MLRITHVRSRALLVAFFTLALSGLGMGGCGGAADILECIGSCSCDDDTRTCACQGGSECVIEGASDITLVCEGNAACDLECDEGCRVECPGTAGCSALMGDDSEAICNGTGNCEFTCQGDCVVDCPGNSSCLVFCAEGAEVCDILNCGVPTDCGDGVLACRTDCPLP